MTAGLGPGNRWRDKLCAFARRSPGERAFDWILFILLVHPFFVGPVLGGALASLSKAHPVRSVLALVGMIIFARAALALWSWLLRILISSWRDPIARILRFSSAILLFGFSVSLIGSFGFAVHFVHFTNSGHPFIDDVRNTER
jgi:hypothetical protein